MHTAILFIALLLVFQQTWADADTDDDEAQPKAIMNALLAAQSGADDRLGGVIFGDLDADGQSDAIALYSHGLGPEGGNQYSQRAALFLSREGRWVLAHHLKVGSKGDRFLRPVAITNRTALFTVTYWRTDDPACCPSGKSATKFDVVDGKLREL